MSPTGFHYSLLQLLHNLTRWRYHILQETSKLSLITRRVKALHLDSFPSPRCRLPLAGCQTLLSPVVSCGPPGVVLSRPVILSMDHCSDACLDNWAVRLKKQNYEGAWEVRRHLHTLQQHKSSIEDKVATDWICYWAHWELSPKKVQSYSAETWSSLWKALSAV